MLTHALRQSPLAVRHRAAGAKTTRFAGWDMPVHYRDGIRAEHRAVRTHAGIFDVSHMGQIEISGAQALALLQRLLSNDVEAIPVGGAQYSVLCREDGGVLDDLFTYRLAADRYLTVTNAANHERDLGWFRRHAEAYPAADVVDAAERFAMLAVQGPAARGIVQAVADGPLPARMRVARLTIAGQTALVCGTGYTGEDGVELLLDPRRAPAAWDVLIEAGARPVGLGARDTLRLEACYHLYGQDLGVDRGPIEAGLGWCCKERTAFIGADAVARARTAGTAERLVPLRLLGPGIPRPGNAVLPAGTVSSGTLSPCLGAGIGMAYVPADLAEVGTALQIDVRGRLRDAEVAARPLFSSGQAA